METKMETKMDDNSICGGGGVVDVETGEEISTTRTMKQKAIIVKIKIKRRIKKTPAVTIVDVDTHSSQSHTPTHSGLRPSCAFTEPPIPPPPPPPIRIISPSGLAAIARIQASLRR